MGREGRRWCRKQGAGIRTFKSTDTQIFHEDDQHQKFADHKSPVISGCQHVPN